MREKGELDVLVHDNIKAQKEIVKKAEAYSKVFPTKSFADQGHEIVHPAHALQVGNPLFQTSSMQYGNKPVPQDVPTKYFPRPPKFTETFLGGQFADTGLNTHKTPHRVHGRYDA